MIMDTPKYTPIQWAKLKWRNGYRLTPEERQLLSILGGRGGGSRR
jgi:hypothetical protein